MFQIHQKSYHWKTICFIAEELFAKAREYLQSGCQEIWLLFPESQLVLINSQQRWILFNPGDMVTTQTVLPGFSVAVNELLA